MTEQTELKPPPEHAHLRWHWIEHTAMGSEEKIWPEAWTETHWLGRVLQKTTPELAYLLGWRYHGPCSQAAIIPDPTNEAMMECVMNALRSENVESSDPVMIRKAVRMYARRVLTALAKMEART
jgi:hypothetical protein